MHDMVQAPVNPAPCEPRQGHRWAVPRIYGGVPRHEDPLHWAVAAWPACSPQRGFAGSGLASHVAPCLRRNTRTPRQACRRPAPPPRYPTASRPPTHFLSSSSNTDVDLEQPAPPPWPRPCGRRSSLSVSQWSGVLACRLGKEVGEVDAKCEVMLFLGDGGIFLWYFTQHRSFDDIFRICRSFDSTKPFFSLKN